MLFLLLVSPTLQFLPAHGQEVGAASVPGEVLVGMSPRAGVGVAQAAISSSGGTITGGIDELNVVIVSVAAGDEDRFIRSVLSQGGGSVAYAERNYQVQLALVPPDPSFAAEQAWHYTLINAPLAWDTTQGVASVKVAMLDTGIDLDHPDLAANIWTNPGEVPADGIDNDGNGFIDDVRGWNFRDNNNNVQDEAAGCVGHGTHTSGTVAEVTNGIGGLGVASGVTVMPIKVLGTSLLPCNGSFADIANGVTYAVNNGARVISMSIGCGGAGACPFSAALNAAYTFAETNGVLVVIAAGNDFAVDDWSLYTGTLFEVSAIDQFSTQASYSNFGAGVDITAPGGDDDNADGSLNEPGSNEGVFSTRLDNTYGWLIGTSMATPHVAGCAALLLSVNAALNAVSLRTILSNNAVDLGAPGKDPIFGAGLVNCKAAIDSIKVDGRIPEFPLFDSQRTGDKRVAEGTSQIQDAPLIMIVALIGAFLVVSRKVQLHSRKN